MMGNIRFGVPEELARAVHSVSNIRVAIETGTYLGQSTLVLASVFDKVWTIEPVQEHVRHASATLSAAGVLSRVETVLGESEVVLPGVLNLVNEPAVFWLDSHWFERIELHTRPQCPLLAEISIIGTWAHASYSWLLIDDVALFQLLPTLPGYRPEEWPTIEKVTDIIAETFHSHVVIEMEDVLVVAPNDNRTFLASLSTSIS